MSAYDIAVIGGGVVGASIATRASEAGLSVALIERERVLGAKATSAAIGGITSQSDNFCLGPLGFVAELSRVLYPAWLERLTSLSGIAIPVLSSGQLQVALQEDELHRLRESVVPAWLRRGYNVAKLTKQRLHYAEPLLSNAVLGAYLLHDEFALEPAVLMQSLTLALQRQGVEVLTSTEVLHVEEGETDVSITLTGGGRLRAQSTVMATGREIPDDLLVPPEIFFPVKGQAIELASPLETYPLNHHIYAKIRDEDGVRYSYLVPRADGRLVAGVTYELGRGDSLPTEPADILIRRGLADLLPSSRNWPQIRHWAGVRPGIKDGIPVIGRDPRSPRIIYSLGHYGLGVTLAPVTAEIVLALITNQFSDDRLQMALGICDPARFHVDEGSRDR